MQHRVADWYERFFEVLARIAQLLASETEQRETLTTILEELYFKLGLAKGTVILFSPSEVELFAQTPSASLSPWHRNLGYRPYEGVVGAVIQSRQPMILPRSPDEAGTSAGAEGPKESGSGRIEFVCVPIFLRGDVIGVISADLPSGEDDAIEDIMRFLKVAANLIASDVRTRRVNAVREESAHHEDRRGHDVLAEHGHLSPVADEHNALRELQQRIRRLEDCILDAVQARDGSVPTNDQPPPVRFSDLRETTQEGPLRGCIRLIEKVMIMRALRDTQGNTKKAAAQLGISGRVLSYKVDKLGIDKLWFTRNRG
jgi:transcriptional regulator with GAF, ATPase, and Fis domain